jgi:hypothetical protein
MQNGESPFALIKIQRDNEKKESLPGANLSRHFAAFGEGNIE